MLYLLMRIPGEDDDPGCFYGDGTYVPNLVIGVYGHIDKAKAVAEGEIKERNKDRDDLDAVQERQGKQVEAQVTYTYQREKKRRPYVGNEYVIVQSELNATNEENFPE